MSLIRKHGAVLQAWACLALVIISFYLFIMFTCCIRFVTYMLQHGLEIF